MLRVINLDVANNPFMLSVIMLNVSMLRVVAPYAIVNSEYGLSMVHLYQKYLKNSI
jgi:hypothetical protein